jgi:magnesium chelatase family protein
MKKIYSSTLQAHRTKVVEVESTFLRALPGFSITGLASSSVLESRDRVKSALQFIDYKFPPQKININLAPAEESKEGAHFDLPIALSIALQKSSVEFDDIFVYGELGLDGSVKDTDSIFPMILELKKQNRMHKVVIPKESVDKVSKIPQLELYAVEKLEEAIEFFKSRPPMEHSAESIAYPHIALGEKKYYYNPHYEEDFVDVKGQPVAKRAALIAAAGFHNILFEGSPGSGKSMSVKRLRHILPPMDLEEILESAKLHAYEKEHVEFKPLRPYRAVHHSSSKPSIVGGGSKSAMVGEVALAHNGILFFDELPHFSKAILESLREPLEDHRLLISRVYTKVEYETKLLFAAAMNPCPCGNLLSATKECRCSEPEVLRYKNRLSDPLLERIDLYVQMLETSPDDQPTISSNAMHQEVLQAFTFQKERGQEEYNGKLSEKDMQKYCIMDAEAERILENAAGRFNLSQRAINKSRKIARTIADLKASKMIKKTHMLEALSYRKR